LPKIIADTPTARKPESVSFHRMAGRAGLDELRRLRQIYVFGAVSVF